MRISAVVAASLTVVLPFLLGCSPGPSDDDSSPADPTPAATSPADPTPAATSPADPTPAATAPAAAALDATAPDATSPDATSPATASSGCPAPEAPTLRAGTARRYPGERLDLTNWYLTLPTGESGHPDTVRQPDLSAYTSDWFHLDNARGGVAFTANAGGATTEHSHYPRSELREMDGAQKASWSSTSGTHTLDVCEAVTALPAEKPEVVTAQIHDTKSDVVEIRLEGTRLLAQYDDGDSNVTLDPAYQLGTPYEIRIVAADGHVTVSYNGVQMADIPRSGSGWYFKTGSYVQSNPSKGEQPDAVGSVVISALSVTHSP